jgi:hypothetical protein
MFKQALLYFSTGFFHMWLWIVPPVCVRQRINKSNPSGRSDVSLQDTTKPQQIVSEITQLQKQNYGQRTTLSTKLYSLLIVVFALAQLLQTLKFSSLRVSRSRISLLVSII